MDATLHQLGQILLNALPTFFLVIVLTFYLKAVFFKPMDRVMRQRYEATEGARQRAKESLEMAARKIADYESAMRAARAEVYLAQEKLHKQLAEAQMAELQAARQRADAAIKQAKDQLAKEAEAARAELAGQSAALANMITESILRRSAA